VVYRDVSIVRVQNVRVHSFNTSLVPVTPCKLSHGRPHILGIHSAMQLAQTGPVMLLNIFTIRYANALASSTW